MAKELVPSQIGCIDLEDYAKMQELISVALSVLDGNKCKEYEILSKCINIFPLTPLLEDAWENGFETGLRLEKDTIISEKKDAYIQSPIKININENGRNK